MSRLWADTQRQRDWDRKGSRKDQRRAARRARTDMATHPGEWGRQALRRAWKGPQWGSGR